MSNTKEVSSCVMECDACFLPFRLIETELNPAVPERLVQCKCPECNHFVANVATEHELSTEFIH